MRPRSLVRCALERVLHAGASGTFDALAHRAGVAPQDAQWALQVLAASGTATVKASCQQEPGKRGRPRAVYALAQQQDANTAWLRIDHLLALKTASKGNF